MNVATEIARANGVSAALEKVTKLLAGGRLAEAKTLCQRALTAYPQDAEIHNLMGIVSVTDRRNSEALYYFQFAVSREPNNVGYLSNLGRLFMKLERTELAIPVFMRIMKLDPKYAAAVTGLGEFFQKMGRADKGLPMLENYLKLNPDTPNVLAMYAQGLETAGRLDEATDVYLKLEKMPDQRAFSLNRLANLKRQTNVSPLLDRINEMAGQPGLRPDQIKSLHAASGKILEDVGEYDRAFEHYRRAAELDIGGFNLDLWSKQYDRQKELFTPELFAQQRHVGHDSDLPVLVVGMPRSGTTLTEQIIARHPLADGAGELVRLRSMARTLGYKRDLSDFVVAMQTMTAEQSKLLSENYLQLLRFYSKTAQRVVDKLPHNFEMLGFAAVLFPNMHVVHCRRDAIDTCLSIYVNRFNEAHKYANDLVTLGKHYRQYSALMDHWKTVLPVPIYESHYEELTADPDAGARALISHIDLPWDDACLTHAEAKSTVRTLSLWQVRQPIYKTSVKRWKRFEKHLGPLIDALGDRADAA